MMYSMGRGGGIQKADNGIGKLCECDSAGGCAKKMKTYYEHDP